MQDRSSEGFGYLAAALLPAAIAVASQNPLVKLPAAVGTVLLVAKAGECFQDTAKHTYYQLKQASESRQLRQGY